MLFNSVVIYTTIDQVRLSGTSEYAEDFLSFQNQHLFSREYTQESIQAGIMHTPVHVSQLHAQG